MIADDAVLADLKATQQDELEATVGEMEEELVTAQGELGDTVAELEAQHQVSTSRQLSIRAQLHHYSSL